MEVKTGQHTPGPWEATGPAFTPGPWRIEGQDKPHQRVIWSTASPLPIADCGKTNAKLIAAAPDMFESLTWIAAQAAEAMRETDPDMRASLLSDIVINADLATSKAFGEPT